MRYVDVLLSSMILRWPSKPKWEEVQATYWLRNCAHRRHHEPFAKTRRGLLRRKTRLFIRQQEHSL